MLSKKNRITGKKDFERIFRKGTSFKEKFLILKIIRTLLPLSRFAFVVSQKVSKNATVRNKIRRRLRELIKKQINNKKNGIDGVFIVLPGLEDKNFQEMNDILNNLLKKAKLIY